MNLGNNEKNQIIVERYSPKCVLFFKKSSQKTIIQHTEIDKIHFQLNVNNISDRYGNACRHFRWQPPYWPLWSPRSMTLSHEYNPIIKTWWTMATRHIRGDLHLNFFLILFLPTRGFTVSSEHTNTSQDNTHTAMRLDIFIWPMPKPHCVLYRHPKILLIGINRT